ncbi:MAG: secondary thiamine-phosphate synthase enzyme YjbQ [Candidatus Acidiferrum sp.]
MHTLHVKTKRRTQLVDITDEVKRIVSGSGVKSGVCFLYVPHTTAGVLINEHADPDVAADAEGTFDRLVPDDPVYGHSEGNTDSHVKTMLSGMNQFIFVENGELALGRWQGIFFAEFDGPRERKLYLKIQAD